MYSRFAVFILLLSSTGWGLTWLPIKTLGNLGVHGLHLLLFICASISLFLLPWMLSQRTRWIKVWPLMLLIALFGGMANIAFQASILYGDVIRVMILFYMLPVWSIVGGHLLLGEVIDRRRVIAALLCIGGVALILELWQVSWNNLSWVDALALLSGASLAACSILFRFTANTPFASKIGFMFLGGLILISSILLFFPIEIQWPDQPTIFWVIAYGLGWIMIISFGSMWGVSRLGAGRGSILIVVELVVAVVSVLILTNTQLPALKWLGCIMVLTAAILEGIRQDEPTPFKSPI